jgi:hypothetical protein
LVVLLVALPLSLLGLTATSGAVTPALKLTPAGTYNLKVPADIEWYSTGLIVGPGDVLSVTATGEWSYAPGQWVGPAGRPGTSGGLANGNADSLVAKVPTPQSPLAGGIGLEVGTHASWTDTAPMNVLYMSMNAVNDNFVGTSGELSVTVTITTLQATVNGFTVSNANSPYQVAERQMLAKIPGAMVLPSAGTPLCSLYPVAVDEAQNAMWTRIRWIIAPSAVFLDENPAARLASTKQIANSLASLLNLTYKAYMAQLRADGLPRQGGDFAQSWAVEVQSISTTGETMSFQVSTQEPSPTPVDNWSGLPTMPPGQGAQGPRALSVLLSYSTGAPTPATPPTSTSSTTSTVPVVTTTTTAPAVPVSVFSGTYTVVATTMSLSNFVGPVGSSATVTWQATPSCGNGTCTVGVVSSSGLTITFIEVDGTFQSIWTRSDDCVGTSSGQSTGQTATVQDQLTLTAGAGSPATSLTGTEYATVPAGSCGNSSAGAETLQFVLTRTGP